MTRASILSDFFDSDNGVSIDDTYNEACTNGTMRSASVEARSAALTKHFVEYLGADSLRD